MSYVYEYDIVAIVFTFIIIITFLRNKTIETSITKIFTILITDVIIADFFDLLTNYTINNSDKIPIWLNALLLMIFYITYNSFVPLICLFLLIQTGTPLKIKNKKFLICSLPYFLAIFLIIVSPFLHTVSYFDSDYNYHYGIFFIGLYIIAGFYILVSLYITIKNRNNFSLKQKRIFYMFLCSCVGIALVQLLPHFRGLSLACLMFSISVYFLYRSLKNPEDYIDSEADIFNDYALKTVMSQIVQKKNKTKKNIIAIQLMGIDYLNNTIGEEKRLVILKQIVHLLQIAVGKNNLYRYSNSRFVAIIPYDQNLLEKTVEKIRCIFEDTFRINEMVISISVRISHFSIPEDADDFETVFELIENSLDNLLDSAPGTIMHVKKDILEGKRREKYILKILREACETNDFEVYYQPIFSVKENRFVAAEALLRFKNPELKLISPKEFIPLAEKNGMILQIEDFVLQSVCKFLRESKICDIYFRCIYLNISAIQYMQETFISRFVKTLDSYGIDHDKIVYDVNEVSSLLLHKDFDKRKEVFLEEGIHFALNEFGYGSFDILSTINYPIRCIKIDKELIWSAEKDEDLRTILSHIIKSIESLDIRVIAEGIETESQAQMLKELKCKYLQGFYFMKAVPANQLLKELEGKQ